MRLSGYAVSLVTAATCGLLAAPARAENVSWNNAAGGNWNVAANWDPPKVPEAQDDVFINLAGTYTVTLNVDTTVARLTVGGGAGTQTLANASRTLTLQGASVIQASGVYSQSGGTLAGSGDLTVNGAFDWLAGTMSGTGGTNIATIGQLNITTTSAKAMRRSISNAGATTWTGSGGINSGDSAVFTNQAGATFNIQNDATLSFNLGGGSSQFVNQAGATVTKGLSAGTTTFTNVPFVHNGVVNVNSGVLTINGGGMSIAPFNITDGARLEFNIGTYNLGAGSGFAGMGVARLGGATLTVLANTNAVNFDLASGTLNGGADFTVSGTCNWTGGTMAGSGATNIAAPAQLNITTASAKAMRRSVNNAGTTTWTSTGGINSGDAAVFTNQAGATFNIQNDATLSFNLGGGSSQFVNQAGATVTKSLSGGTTTFTNVPFVHNGVVNVNTGVLTLNGGGMSMSPFNIAGGARLDFNAGTYNLGAGSGFAGMGVARLGGATLTVLTNTNAVNFDLASGTLDGGADFTVSGTCNWTGGTMSGSGATNIAAPARLNIASASAKAMRRSINNAGTTTWTDSGGLNSGDAAVFTNQAGASFSIENDRTFAFNLGGGPSQFVNQSGATLTKRLSGGTTTFSSVPFLQNGEVNVDAGVLALNGGGTSMAPFNIAAGATLNFNIGTYNLAAGSGFVGMGATRLSGGTLTVLADTNAEHFDLASGTLNGGANFTVTGTCAWTGGTMDGNGATNIAAAAALNLAGASTKAMRRSINNAGITTWTDSGGINSGNSAVFTNQAGASFSIENDRTFAFNLGGGTSQLVNQAGATLTKRLSGGTTTFANVAVLNNGTVNINSGIAAFNGTYAQMAGATHLAGGDLATSTAIILQGGILDGTGSVLGSLTNNGGQVNPGTSPGQLRTTVDFAQTSGGTFNVDIDGLVAGIEFDQLVVTRNVSLAGALNVVAGSVPTPGSIFTIIDNDAADAVAGVFSGLPEGATVDASGAQFTISYIGGTGNDVILTAVDGVPATLTPSATHSPTLTNTPSMTVQATSTPTNTFAPSATPTASIAPQSTPTSTPTSTASPSVTATRTPTNAAAFTDTPGHTATPSATEASTPTFTATAGPPTPTASPTPTPPGTITLFGRIVRPGIGGEARDRGQVPAAGAMLRLYNCAITRRAQCLDDLGDVVATAVADARGRFFIDVPAELVIPRRLFVLEATIRDLTVFRLRTLALARGRSRDLGAGGAAGFEDVEVLVDVISEAAVQLLDQEGLETFTDDGIEGVIESVFLANDDANFESSSPEDAISAALTTAVDDPGVQMVLRQERVSACVGDCDGDGFVTVDEIVGGIGIALGNIDILTCPALDPDGSGSVTVDEIITAVNNALNGCPR